MKRTARASQEPDHRLDVQAITFDVGGTLIEPWPSVGHVYSEVAEAHGCPGIPDEILNQRFAQAWRQLKEFRHTRQQWAELVDASFGSLVPQPPSRTFFPEVYERFAGPEAWHVFEDVLPALEFFKSRGLKLGVISNWDERLRPLLRKLKLEAYFGTIIISCEIGSPKPSVRIFRAAAHALESPPERILHVGDSFNSDVLGARAAGFQALWLRRSTQAGHPGEICSLRELSSNLQL